MKWKIGRNTGIIYSGFRPSEIIKISRYLTEIFNSKVTDVLETRCNLRCCYAAQDLNRQLKPSKAESSVNMVGSHVNLAIIEHAGI